MMFIKSSTTSIVFFALLLLLMGVYVFPLLKKLELNCEFGSLKEVFKNCKTDTLNKERFNDFTFLKVKV